jgi:hypothetical protein
MSVIEKRDAIGEYRRVDEMLADERGSEGEVLLPSGQELGRYAVVRIQAVASPWCGARGFDEDETIPPAAGQCGRGDADALGVVAVSLMEGGQLAEHTVHQVGLRVVGIVEKVMSTSIEEIASIGSRSSGRPPRTD